MDFLQAAISKKKRTLEQGGGAQKKAKKYQTRREREEEREQSRTALPDPPPLTPAPTPAPEASAALLANAEAQEGEGELQHPREEVVRRLRAAGQVVTYFGETDVGRERRWLELETATQEGDAFAQGQANEFDRLLREMDDGDDFRAAVETQEEAQEKEGRRREIERFLAALPPIEDTYKTVGAGLADEDKILLMCRRILKEWECEIDLMEEADKKAAKGRKLMATFKQTKIYLRPLFASLKQKGSLDAGITENLMKIADCLVKREYKEAGHYYIQLAVGNAPWPIGVTMVGIHARTAREKIQSNQVAHVLNDETQRKYIQSVKRLITFCQRKYPTIPSKCLG